MKVGFIIKVGTSLQCATRRTEISIWILKKHGTGIII